MHCPVRCPGTERPFGGNPASVAIKSILTLCTISTHCTICSKDESNDDDYLRVELCWYVLSTGVELWLWEGRQ
jgi:hypothetical protein